MPFRRESVVSILRLSDSHIHAHASADEARQVVVIRHLTEDFARLRREFGAPDVVLITGDLAQSGTAEEYEEANRLPSETEGQKQASRSLIQTIVEAFGISRNRIYIVPGNHDVDDKLAQNYDNGLKLHDKHREHSASGMDTLVGSKKQHGAKAVEARSIFKKFSGFVQFCKQSFPHCAISKSKPYFIHEWRPHRNPKFVVDPIRICGLNTAYLSYRGDFESADWKMSTSPLALGSQQINEVVKDPEDMLRFVMMHHPPELLADGEQLLAELEKVPNILFVGHMHQQQAEIMDVVAKDGQIVFRAAATYLPIKEQGGRRQHGYDFLRITPDGIEYYPRRHITGQASFRSGVEDEPENSEDGGEKIGRRLFIKREILPKLFLNWLDKQKQQLATSEIVGTSRRQTGIMAAIPGTMPPPPNLPQSGSDPEIEDIPQKDERKVPVNPFAETVREMPSPDALRREEITIKAVDRPMPPEEKVVPAVQTLPPPPLEESAPIENGLASKSGASLETKPVDSPSEKAKHDVGPHEPFSMFHPVQWLRAKAPYSSRRRIAENERFIMRQSARIITAFFRERRTIFSQIRADL